MFTLLTGDFLQLPPVGRPSLAFPLVEYDDTATSSMPPSKASTDKEAEEKDENHRIEHRCGYALWHDIQFVMTLDLNMRTTGVLCTLLQNMRDRSISDAAWDALQNRGLQPDPDTGKDPRLNLPPFANNMVHYIVHRHALRVSLSYSIALQESIRSQNSLYVVHACDTVPQKHARHFTAELRRTLLQRSNPRDTAGLPSYIPAYIGMRYRLQSCTLACPLAMNPIQFFRKSYLKIISTRGLQNAFKLLYFELLG